VSRSSIALERRGNSSTGSQQASNQQFQPPLQGVFARPGPETPLVLVSFKCCRAELYYLPDNTGLNVNVGDLVVVEADRGVDLGTVVNMNLSWEEARALKDQAGMDHLGWLVMFSRHNEQSQHAQGIHTPNAGMMFNAGVDLNTMNLNLSQPIPQAPQPAIGSGLPLAHHAASHGKAAETGAANEIRPRMIKRLAQRHEIDGLRDKEGNEAKAKRICQQKVIEHGLDMEILDAEFQV